MEVSWRIPVVLQEPGYSDTNWHSDLRMAPLDTNDFVTAWIPLRRIKVRETCSAIMHSNQNRSAALSTILSNLKILSILFCILQASQDSGLVFASGSHRDFALPFWHSTSLENMDLSARGYPISSLGKLISFANFVLVGDGL